MEDQRPDIEAAAVLEDPTRAAIFAFVRDASGPVTREDVADGVGVSPRLAGFHLAKLAERNLVVEGSAQASGRAGRPAKRYEPSRVEVQVSIPERRYELAALLMMRALRELGRGALGTAATVARAHGEGFAKRTRTRGRAWTRERELLRALGYEPVEAGDGTMTLRNCPFHALVADDADLVCGVNHALVSGLVEGAGGGIDVRVTAGAPGCCVSLISSGTR